MPFLSKSQRRHLWKVYPELAAKFEAETPFHAKLPEKIVHVKIVIHRIPTDRKGYGVGIFDGYPFGPGNWYIVEFKVNGHTVETSYPFRSNDISSAREQVTHRARILENKIMDRITKRAR